MADVSDVEDALCGVILGAVYPQGLSAGSINGNAIKIYRGWPNSVALNQDIIAQNQTITVISEGQGTKNTTRYAPKWHEVAYQAPALVISTSGTTCTISGGTGVGQVVGIDVDGVGYAYALTASDTLTSIAAALGDIIPGAVVDGVGIAFPFASAVIARVSGTARSIMETRRQEQKILVVAWCSTPMARDILAGAIDNKLSTIDWLTLADGTMARLQYEQTSERDESVNANVYRRDLVYLVEYPTTISQISAQMMFGLGAISNGSQVACFENLAPATPVTLPKIGAIRFDAWYDPANSIDQQCAAALTPRAFWDRLPANATTGTSVSWPLATQATIDAEIDAACRAGLSFWAFDSFASGDTLSLALQLYLSSKSRTRLGFCMLGQSSNWGDDGRDAPVMLRDVSLMSQPGYVTVAGGRPLYFVLDASSSQLSGLPAGGVATAIATIRELAIASGTINPYIVWLSGAALADYDNTNAAVLSGADAAGSYASPHLNGSPQMYQALAQSAAQDWVSRAAASFPMVPTAMSGWDQRPLIETPQPFYPIAEGVTDANYYQAGTPAEIATHVADMAEFTLSNAVSCPAQVGLVYAWNELAEGGWIMPTWTASGPDYQRAEMTGAALRARAADIAQSNFTPFFQGQA